MDERNSFGYNISAAAKLLRVSPDRIRRLERAGHIRFQRFASARVITAADIERLQTLVPAPPSPPPLVRVPVLRREAK